MHLSFSRKLKILSLIALLLSGCGASNKNVTKAYLTNYHPLYKVGDINGANPNSEVHINWIDGFVDYSRFFDIEKSYLDFHCVGTSYEDFHCVGSIKVVDKNGIIVFEKDSFDCEYIGYQSGYIKFINKEDEDIIGPIWVSVIYRCRWQYECNIGDSGDVILLTFEFWKDYANPLPSFLSYE